MELAFPDVPYERLKGIKEHGFGKFEGITEDLNIEPPFGDFYVQFGGESDEDLENRLRETLTQIMRRPDHESVLAVSHAGACAQFLIMNGWSFDDIVGGMGNCAVITYDFDGDSTFTPVSIDNPCS